MSHQKDVVRVLHVVGVMDRAGIETWLMHILRGIDRERFQMDFLVHSTKPGHYDDEIRALGSRIITCPHPRLHPWAYGQRFKQILRDYGRYDIVHTHVQHYGGVVLRLAHQAGVPKRIAHSHSDDSSLKQAANLIRRFYFLTAERWIRQHATHGLAASQPAAAALFGDNWKSDPRWRVLYCGIDLLPFRVPLDPITRAELGIPPEAFVMGHVGRFREAKNHNLLLETAAAVIRSDPQARLLLVGDGLLRSTVEEYACTLGIADNVIFTGSRPDVPRLMMNAMDIFVLPSLYEGLPVVLIEAQAAGLPCILSDTIPHEAEVIKSFMTRIPLSQPPEVWAKTIQECKGAPLSQPEALTQIEASPFNIDVSLARLEEVYLG